MFKVLSYPQAVKILYKFIDFIRCFSVNLYSFAFNKN